MWASEFCDFFNIAYSEDSDGKYIAPRDGKKAYRIEDMDDLIKTVKQVANFDHLTDTLECNGFTAPDDETYYQEALKWITDTVFTNTEIRDVVEVLAYDSSNLLMDDYDEEYMLPF